MNIKQICEILEKNINNFLKYDEILNNFIDEINNYFDTSLFLTDLNLDQFFELIFLPFNRNKINEELNNKLINLITLISNINPILFEQISILFPFETIFNYLNYENLQEKYLNFIVNQVSIKTIINQNLYPQIIEILLSFILEEKFLSLILYLLSFLLRKETNLVLKLKYL